MGEMGDNLVKILQFLHPLRQSRGLRTAEAGGERHATRGWAGKYTNDQSEELRKLFLQVLFL